MRYAQIHKMNISDGPGIGVSLYVQGCLRAAQGNPCKNCFNPETWSFEGGTEYTLETAYEILNLLNADYMSRLSILGGEPMLKQNYKELAKLVTMARMEADEAGKKDFQIWIWTGRKYEDILIEAENDIYLPLILRHSDVLVDGEFIEELKDLRLHWRGSSNQRVIDLKTGQEKEVD